MILKQLWTHSTDARLAGLSFAREAGRLLAWDHSQRLTIWDRTGQRKAASTLVQAPVAAAISDDGNQVAAVGPNGEVWWLDPDLKLQFDQSIKGPALALALEAFGDYLAVSDRGRRTHIFNRLGQRLAVFETPRPLHHLSFVPTRQRLLGAADYGYVGCYDATGKCLWRDAPLTHVGSLCCNGEGSLVMLASFSEGLRLYDGAGFHLGHLATPAPCRRAVVSFDGSTILTASESASMSLLNRQGRVLETLAIPQSATALVLGALGELGVFGLPTGDVTAVSIQRGP